MTPAQWKGHDRQRDLPMLGVDPDAKSDWEPVDNGLRPDNRDPMMFSIVDGFGNDRGARPDIGRGDHEGPFYSDGDGRALMEYQRELALGQVVARDSRSLAEAEVGLSR